MNVTWFFLKCLLLRNKGNHKMTFSRKGQASNMGTVWLIFWIGVILLFFLLAVPPDYRRWILGE